MSENRKLKRRELIYNLKVTDTESNEPLGRAVDITSEGLKLISYRKLDNGSPILMTIELPIEVFGNKRVYCSAKVCWCKHDVNPDFYACGIQFLEISSDDTETLITVMAQYSFNE